MLATASAAADAAAVVAARTGLPPRTPPAGSSPSDAPGGGDVDGRRAMNDGDAEAAAAAVAAAAAGPSGHNINNTDASFPAGLKVLLVDDDPMCLKVVAAMLER
jgi:hypothetical protein